LILCNTIKIFILIIFDKTFLFEEWSIKEEKKQGKGKDRADGKGRRQRASSEANGTLQVWTLQIDYRYNNAAVDGDPLAPPSDCNSRPEQSMHRPPS
jgi:hypothetical protein